MTQDELAVLAAVFFLAVVVLGISLIDPDIFGF